MARQRPMPVAVLASGSGTLLQAIIDGQDQDYRVAGVYSDRPGVECLVRAERAGIHAEVIDFKSFSSREAFSEALAKAQNESGAELSCSAGFMRVLSPVYFKTFAGPAINSHPALLPAFPGAHAVREALEWGVKVTGTTIHFIDEQVDHGPVIVQEPVEVLSGDTTETLHERIKEVERRLYPEVIRLYAGGHLKLEGRRVHRIG